jgi:site-specific DNA recombinase
METINSMRELRARRADAMLAVQSLIMKKAFKPAPAIADRRQDCGRVSSKEQEKEGFSIPSRLRLLKDYATVNSFSTTQEYADVETAKQRGRAAVGEMVAYLKAHPVVRVMLVEKIDRLYRNFKDWVTVHELDVEVHFPKESVVLSRESHASEKFTHAAALEQLINIAARLRQTAGAADGQYS